MTPTKRADYRCLHRLRVRWAEVDMQKIVFNAHYLMYVDTAMTDYWRELALPYESSLAHLGGDIFVKKASVEYHGSARHDDLLDVGLRCMRLGNSSMLFDAAIFRADTVLVQCELVYVYAQATSPTPQRVPDALRSILEAFEARQPMVTMQLGRWDVLGPQASILRNDVFVQEQGIGAHMVWDDLDADALHAVAKNRLDQPVATGRLLQHAPGVSRIGRMAVSHALRGTGLGRDVLLALIVAARARGDHEVMLHAQCSAEGFYRREGFVARGAVFEEAGVQHIEMVLPLQLKTQ